MRPDVVTKEENADRKKRGPRTRPEVCNVECWPEKEEPQNSVKAQVGNAARGAQVDGVGTWEAERGGRFH